MKQFGRADRSPSPDPPLKERLDSWKEIASYLRRDESTARRWEKDGLPVHRHLYKSRAAVFAYKSELDVWWNRDRMALEARAAATELKPQGARLRSRSTYTVIAAVACVAVGFFAFRLFFAHRAQSAAAAMTLTPFMSSEGEVSYLAFSPDGKLLAFSWANSQLPKMALFVKPLGSETPLRLTYSNDAEDFAPAWSPDGGQIAFLRRAPKEGGIYVIPSLGGPERKLVSLREDRYFALDWSPDGKYLAFAQRASSAEPYCLFLLSLEDEHQRQITFPPPPSPGELRFAFSPDGKHLAFIRNGASVAQPTSIQLMPSAGGTPRILYSQKEWIGSLAWSADSQTLIVTGNHQGVRELWRVSIKDGSEEPLSAAGENAYFPAVSRQGHRLAFVREVTDSDLWRVELTKPRGPGKPPAHIISSTRIEGAPRFSPDGKRIAFRSDRSGSPEIWMSSADGSNAIQLTFLRVQTPETPSWSPDGQTIAFADAPPNQLISVTGGQPRRISNEAGNILGPMWSRDGRYIYYWVGREGAETQVWKLAVAGGHAIQVTKNGGVVAMESPDGKYLYYTKSSAAGIWRMPAGGGEETRVLDHPEPSLLEYWAVFDDGIYYVKTATGSQPTIEFYSFATRRSSRIATMPGQPDAWFGGLTVSPDRRWIVFSQRQYASSEIIVGENFH